MVPYPCLGRSGTRFINARHSAGRDHSLDHVMVGLSGINKVNWNQVGRVTEPGRYQFTFGWLTIGAADLAVWEQYPNAVFTLVNLPAVEDQAGDEYHLGTFELR